MTDDRHDRSRERGGPSGMATEIAAVDDHHGADQRQCRFRPQGQRDEEHGRDGQQRPRQQARPRVAKGKRLIIDADFRWDLD